MRGPQLKYLVESMFDIIRDRCTHDEIAIVCPVPGCGDQSGNRSVNLKNGKTFCWRCNTGGDFIRWAKWVGFAVSDDGVAASTVEDLWAFLDPPKPQSIVPVISEISLPPGFKTCYDNLDSVYTRLIGEMAVRKHLEPQDLIDAGVGYTLQDNKWEPFAIFPVTEYERLVYYQGRTYWDDPGQTTKRFPSRTECPLSSKYWIYNIDELGREGVTTAVVTESVLNVLSLKKKFAQEGITDMIPICVFKHAVSKPQFFKLLRFRNLKEICLLFDFDAIDLSWEDARKIDDLIRVTIAEMPLTTNLKLDPNDDVDTAFEVIRARKKFLLTNLLDRKLKTAELNFYLPYLGNTLFDQQHPIKKSTN